MALKSEWLSYLAGTVLLALPGLINVDNRFYYFSFLGLGWLSLVFTLRQSGLPRPGTAIALLVTTNLAFWLSYCLWKVRARIVGPVQTDGTDPFGLAVSIWLFAIIICAVYESVVLVRALVRSSQQQMSVLGLAGVALQVPTTLRFIYSMIRGV